MVNNLQDISSNSAKKARIATLCLFLVHGLIVSTWASRLPVIQLKLGLDSGQLGFLLLASAIGTFSIIPVTGWFMGRYGSRGSCIVSSLAMCIVLPFLALAKTQLEMIPALLAYGLSAGAMDVAMNAQAVSLEKAYQKSIMVTFHALFSLGGLTGALLGSILAAKKIAPNMHFLCASGAFLFLSGLACFFLIDDRPQTPIAEGKKTSFSPNNRLSWPLICLCIIGFCCFLSEGAIIDWSGIYLFRVLHASESLSALAYASFATAMTIGRFGGDHLNECLGAKKLVLLGCVFALAGIGIVLISTTPYLALIGFLIAGLGFSAIVPLVFAASSIVGGNPNTNLTLITTVSYSAFLLGPPAIGALAQYFDLRLALSLIVALLFLSTFCSKIAFSGQDTKALETLD